MPERARPWIPPAVALALTLLGVGWLVLRVRAAIGGPFVSPLDDAYIHLGVARNLAEHGTWGLNPAEHASASTSPLWTAAIATVFLTIGAQEEVGVLLALASGALLLWVGALSLRDEGLSERAVLAGLILLVLAVPLPFLAALGMEHVLHAALALALVRAALGSGNALCVFLLAAAATLTRYESLALAGGLSLLLARERPRLALASLSGAALAVLGFGLYSLGSGSLFLPNSVLLKAVSGRDLWASLGAAIAEGAPLLALAVAVSLGAAALETGALHRRRAALFALTVLSQLFLGRMGWLYRYEAWLVAWGALLLVSPARLLWRRPGAWALALVLATPLGWRSLQAMERYVVGARFNADVDLTLARWVASEWPDATIAAHDIGALSFLTDATLVDVIGLGTDEIAALKLESQLTPARAEALFAARGVDLAITGRDWLGGEQPASFLEVARLWAPFPEGPGEFETVIWSVDPADQPRLLASLDALERSLSPRARLERVNEVVVELDSVQLSGAAVQREPDQLAFYTNGAGSFLTPIDGELSLTLWGSLAEGRGPRVRVLLRGGEQALEAGTSPRRVRLGRAQAGERVEILYEDDATDASGGDRNLFLREITLRP